MDKRKKLYKTISQMGAVIDLAVDQGGSKVASDARADILRALVRKTLARHAKKMEPRAVQLLIERVGFHPDAVVLETEKLALYAGDEGVITAADLDAVVGRTREEALFEFTEAFSDGNLSQALRIMNHMRENGSHPLMIVAGLYNHLRKLLLVRGIQVLDNPSYSPGMPYGLFQKGYLPKLKEAVAPEVAGALPQHPYAQYMMFKRAEGLGESWLKQVLEDLLLTEMLLKSSGVGPWLLMENLLYKSEFARAKAQVAVGR